MAGTLFGKPRGSVIKHPGALKRAAARSGRSTLQEAQAEAQSDNPKIAARGRLGKRFIEKQI